MADLKASPEILVVDTQAGESSQRTVISYDKGPFDEVWERTWTGFSSTGWTQINVHVRTGQGDDADSRGEYKVELETGQKYEVGVFEERHGPLTRDERRLAYRPVHCLFKLPRRPVLIVGATPNLTFGGTWYMQELTTVVPTEIVLIGASRTKPVRDNAGIPHLVDPDGSPTLPLTLSTSHAVEIGPLFPGNHYFAVTLVTDRLGNWEVVQAAFTALRRKLTVEFPTVHIYNDGDGGGYGEAGFWFRLYSGPRNGPILLQQPDFHLPTQDVDDWSETDRPYPVGFAHVGQPQVVPPGESRVAVASWGVEDDGAFDSDEGAAGDQTIPLPKGRFAENVVSPLTFTMDCPVSTTGDDFRYGVDVRWSVTYVP
jgi:hypothetical protein